MSEESDRDTLIDGEAAEPTTESDEGTMASCVKADVHRRRLLGAIGGAGTVALAGCLGGDDDEDDEANGDEANGDEDEDDEDEDDGTYDITFLEQGETIAVAEDQNLLEAGEAEGWELPYQCRSGVCGQCEAHVNGNGHDLVEMTTNDVLSEEEVEDGAVLTCTGQPRDEFEINTHPDD